MLTSRAFPLLVLLALACGPVLGFVRPPVSTVSLGVRSAHPSAMPRKQAAIMMLTPETVETGTALLVAGEPWATPVKIALEPLLNLGSLAFLIRIVMSWYPQVNLNKFPANVVAWPTEPFLKATRQVVPPAFGVDVSPIVWVAFLSFLKEILTSPQGILSLLEARP